MNTIQNTSVSCTTTLSHFTPFTGSIFFTSRFLSQSSIDSRVSRTRFRDLSSFNRPYDSSCFSHTISLSHCSLLHPWKIFPSNLPGDSWCPSVFTNIRPQPHHSCTSPNENFSNQTDVHLLPKFPSSDLHPFGSSFDTVNRDTHYCRT